MQRANISFTSHRGPQTYRWICTSGVSSRRGSESSNTVKQKTIRSVVRRTHLALQVVWLNISRTPWQRGVAPPKHNRPGRSSSGSCHDKLCLLNSYRLAVRIRLTGGVCGRVDYNSGMRTQGNKSTVHLSHTTTFFGRGALSGHFEVD